MTVDRNALASDLESLGLKAIASGVRNGGVSVKQAHASIKRAYERGQFAGDTARVQLAGEILDRYRGVS